MKRSTLLLAGGVVGYMLWRKARNFPTNKPAPRVPVEGPVHLPDFVFPGSPVLAPTIPDFNPYDFSGAITGIRMSKG